MRGLWLGVVAWGLAGCAGAQASRSYEGTRENVRLLERPPAMVADYPGTNFTLDAQHAWQDTGVRVPRGAQVVVRAQGAWRGWPEELGCFGPEGVRSRPGEAGPEVPWVTPLALMGRLGEDGRPFEIGLRQAFQAAEEGALQLAVNESHLALERNAGRIRVRIVVLAPGEGP